MTTKDKTILEELNDYDDSYKVSYFVLSTILIIAIQLISVILLLSCVISWWLMFTKNVDIAYPLSISASFGLWHLLGLSLAKRLPKIMIYIISNLHQSTVE